MINREKNDKRRNGQKVLEINALDEITKNVIIGRIKKATKRLLISTSMLSNYGKIQENI